MMKIVLLTALGVGGATIFGSLIGFVFRKISHKFSDIVLSFAAGVMLSAAVLGLILPSLNYGGTHGILVSIIGIFTGAVCLHLIDKLVPHLHRLVGTDTETHRSANLDKVLLFVTAIAIHNLPEGMVVGLAAALALRGEPEAVSGALALALGIGLQNIPEGAAVSLPLAQAGQGRRKAFCAGAASGLVEPLGALLALALAGWVSAALPWLMSAAAGCMVCVTAQEMIPEAVGQDEPAGVISVVLGFALMMALDIAL